MHTSTLGRDWVTEDGNSEAKEKPSSASMITLAVDEIAALGEVGKYKVGKGFEFKPHQHGNWLVVTVLSGRVEVQLEGEDESTIYGPGEVYVVEANHAPHRETMLEDTEVVVIGGPGLLGERYEAHTVDV
jgi:quercetin dioxygenase-like cupin family protein